MARSVNDVRLRCALIDTHWIWKGAMSGGAFPRIYAPDHTSRAGEMATQNGGRAVWHLKHGKAIPTGWRVFRTCTEPRCLNPDHLACEAVATRGAKVAASGVLKGQVRRITANRATCRKRSKLTPELVELIRSSEKTGIQLTKETGVGRTTISRVRKGHATAFDPVGGVFSGMLRGMGASA